MSSETFHKALGETEELTEALIGHLSLVRHILDSVTPVRTFAAAAHAIARGLVVELGFERAAVVVAGTNGQRDIIGQHSQSERFGVEYRLPEAERRAISAIAGKVIEEAKVFFWSGDNGADGLGTLPIEGSLTAMPLVVGGEKYGAVVGQRLISSSWDVIQQKAFELISEIIGQVLTVTQLRISLLRMRDEIESELGRTRSKVVAQEQTLKAQSGSIARLTEALIASSRMKSDFLGIISHELRTPLNVILGYSAMLHEGASGPLSGEQAEQIERILCNGRNLSHLVDDILFFVQTESTKLTASRERFELAPLIEEVCAALPETSNPRAPQLQVRVDPEAASLVTDRLLLRRILFHLLSNSYKFTEAGHVRVEVGPGEDAEVVKFRVSDSGAGIPKDKLEAIFYAAQQVDRSARRQFGEAGLGLILVRRCLQLLGGSLSVESAVGEGTEVVFTIPNALSPQAARTGT